MTDQTPRTDAWRDLMVDIYAHTGQFNQGELSLEQLIYQHRPAIEAQARTEGLDVIEAVRVWRAARAAWVKNIDEKSRKRLVAAGDALTVALAKYDVR